MKDTIRQLFWFTVVGTLGFVVDSSVLYAGLAIGLGPYVGRVISYIAAATTTWYLNRKWTFKPTHKASRSEYMKFVVLNLGGFVVNYGTYVLCLHAHPVFAQHPVLAVAAGSIAGLFVNFGINKFLVFKTA